jgi:hypothetical protein
MRKSTSDIHQSMVDCAALIHPQDSERIPRRYEIPKYRFHGQEPLLVKPDRESVPPQVDLYQKRPSTYLDPKMGKAPVVLPRIRAQLPGDVCFNYPSRPSALTHTESSVLSSLLKDSLLPSSSKYALQQEVVRRYGYDAGQRDMALLKILLSVILMEVDTSAMLSPIILQSCFKRMEYRIYLLLYIPQPS